VRYSVQNWFAAAIMLLFIVFLSSHAAAQGTSNKESDNGCAPLVRKHRIFHRLIWSGIFPGEGGFISDPHCLASDQMAFSKPALKLLGSPNATYEVMDVDPFFNDDSSEIVLLIRAGGDLFEYSFDFPKRQNSQAVLAMPGLPSARIFPYRGKLAVLADFSGPAKGAYLLELPLRTTAHLGRIPINTPEFDEIALEFKTIGLDTSVKDQFCKTTNDFAAFYERHAGSCDWSPEIYAVNRAVHDYDFFWKQN
jgi:hypothetical protein